MRRKCVINTESVAIVSTVNADSTQCNFKTNWSTKVRQLQPNTNKKLQLPYFSASLVLKLHCMLSALTFDTISLFLTDGSKTCDLILKYYIWIMIYDWHTLIHGHWHAWPRLEDRKRHVPPINEGANWNSGGHLQKNFGCQNLLPSQFFIACSTPSRNDDMWRFAGIYSKTLQLYYILSSYVSFEIVLSMHFPHRPCLFWEGVVWPWQPRPWPWPFFLSTVLGLGIGLDSSDCWAWHCTFWKGFDLGLDYPGLGTWSWPSWHQGHKLDPKSGRHSFLSSLPYPLPAPYPPLSSPTLPSHLFPFSTPPNAARGSGGVL